MSGTARKLPIVVIGAGPVGLAAAAQLLARGLEPLVLEKEPGAGGSIREWGHVRVFTPWRFMTDAAVRALLEPTGWRHPDPDRRPTGAEFVEAYLEPAATSTALKDKVIFGARVTAASKRGLSKSSSVRRDAAPFSVRYVAADGAQRIVTASAVIDASGTWFNPNPIGADGLPVPGEDANQASIAYGVPDTLGAERAVYAGKETLVLGGGHSAINVVLDLLRLRAQERDARLIWGLRRNTIERLLGGGLNDELPARGALGVAAKEAIDSGALELLAPLSVERIEREDGRLRVEATVDGAPRAVVVDRVIVAAGFRPDLEILRELRLELDHIVEAPVRLAPMIDPNEHSCGTVSPHGVRALAHPDANIFIVGMKAYGRAPTFLMRTGYEQVRSIADALAGNMEAAERVELTLPKTGACCGGPGSSAGDPAEEDAAAICGGGAKARRPAAALCC